MVELLDKRVIAARLSAPVQAWLKELTIHPEIASTNAELVLRARQGHIDGLVHLAEHQTAGRGRRGRQWLSPRGANIALSIGLEVDRAPSQLGGLSLAIGLATIDAIATCGVEDLALKWPNDVLFKGRKLGGILVEIVDVRAPVSVVIGVGLNMGIGEAIKAQIDQPVADVLEGNAQASRNVLAAALMNALFEYARAFEAAGFAPMREAWTEHHALQGQLVRIVLGDRTEEGRVVGVSDAGTLLVNDGDRTREYVSGEVSVRAKG